MQLPAMVIGYCSGCTVVSVHSKFASEARLVLELWALKFPIRINSSDLNLSGNKIIFVVDFTIMTYVRRVIDVYQRDW